MITKLNENSTKTSNFLNRINTSTVQSNESPSRPHGRSVSREKLNLSHKKTVSFVNTESMESPKLDNMMHCLVDLDTPKPGQMKTKPQRDNNPMKKSTDTY